MVHSQWFDNRTRKHDSCLVNYLNLADLVGLKFGRAVVVNDADAAHELSGCEAISSQNEA